MTASDADRSSSCRVWFSLYPWMVCVLKVLLPALLARLLMLIRDMHTAREAVQVRVALIPLEQWVSVLVLVLVVQSLRGIAKPHHKTVVARVLLHWVPLAIAAVFVFHEWFVQYPALIRTLGVTAQSGADLLTPLSQ